MTIKLVFILSLLLIPNFAMACECSEKADNSGALELANRSDIIVLGRALELLDSSKYDQRAVNVIFKIDSVIKGPADLDQIIINQFTTGNCVKIFEIGEQYLITGLKIEKFVLRLDQKNSEDKLAPPPPNRIEENKVICYDCKPKELEYWNGLARTNFIVSTDQCRSFKANSEMANYFRKEN